MSDEPSSAPPNKQKSSLWQTLASRLAPKRSRASVQSGGASVTGGVTAQRDFIGRDSIRFIVNNYIQGGGKVTDPSRIAQKLQAYLEWAKRQYSLIPLFSYHPGDRKMRPIAIEAAYVAFDAEVERFGGVENRDDLEARLRNLGGRLSFEHVLMLGPRLAVTADAGMGKSIVLLWLAHALAEAILTDMAMAVEALNLSRPLPAPIYLPLGLYARHLKRATEAQQQPQSLPSFIDAYLHDNTLGLPDDFFSVLIGADAPVVLLLDGLDEIVDDGQRAVVSAHIQSLSNSKDTVRFVVTCREVAYRGRARLDQGFIHLKPAPFEPRHVRELIDKAYCALYDITHLEQYREAMRQVEALMSSIRQLEERRQKQATKPIPSLIDSPLMARLAMIVHSYAGSLPEQRTELLMKAVEALLSADYELEPGASQWLASLVGGDWETHRDILQDVAFSMQRDETLELAEPDLKSLLLRTHAPHAEAVMQIAKSRGGLLTEWNGRYRFVHPSLQQALAACHLCAASDPEALADFLVEDARIAADWWREVAFLVAGYFTAATNPSRDERRLAQFLLALAERGRSDALAPATRFACVEVAAQAADEFLPEGLTVRAELAKHMAAVMDDDDAMAVASPRSRAAVGNLLGKFGDPRGYALRVDEMRLCVVPSGPFRMGSDACDPDALENEKCDDAEWNRKGCDVAYGYLIGQHPVTTAQFNEFIADGGYDNPAWWDAARRAGVWKDGKIKCRVARLAAGVREPQTIEEYWALVREGQVGEDEEEANRPWNFEERLRDQPNHPVVGVTWYEALAFCKWLEARWRGKGWLTAAQEVKLPSEPEWEKAARGGFSLPSPVGEGPGVGSWIENPNPARTFPWGDQPDPALANWRETGIGATSAVGCFPHGRSPYGCHDMSGNVSEWTRSLYGFRASLTSDAQLDFPYPYHLDDGRERLDAGTSIARVARGGSFYLALQYARAAVRIVGQPINRNVYYGFRVVVSPISLSPLTSDSLNSGSLVTCGKAHLAENSA